jgi:hypothetical protein
MRYILRRLLSTFVLVSAITSLTVAQTFRPLYPDPISHGGDIAWADYDQDGDPDLITSGVLKEGIGKTILYRNDGGDFHDVQEFDEPTGRIQWMDLDDDGDLDLILAFTMIKILMNENGIFVDQPRVGSYNFQVWTDYNHDDEPDMFASTNEGIVKFYKEGGRLLQYEVGIFSEVTAFNVADYNNDGHYDVLVQQGPVHASTIALYMNDGNENFTIDENITFLTIPIVTLSSFDFDDDGDTDIMLSGTVSGESTPSTHLYENKGDRFELSANEFFQTGYPRIRNLTSDDKPDIIKVTAGGDSLVFYENAGGGQYVEVAPLHFSDYRDPAFIGYASASGESPDGYLCVSGTLYNGNFSTRIFYRTNGVYENIYPNPFDQLQSSNLLQWTDYNKDGLVDAYASGRSQPSYGPYGRLLRNNGAGGFEPRFDFPYNKTGKGDWLDFNKDGTIDFMTVVARDVVLYEGFDGPGPVTVKKILSQVDETAYPKVVDFDRDGDNDIFINGYFEGLYVNNNNVFTKSITFGDWYSWTGRSDWADYDRDGDEDIFLYVEAGDLADQPRLYNNNGGSFSNVPGLSFPQTESAHVRWIDYNVDGFPDLFLLGLNSIDSHSHRITPILYRNDHGSFIPESAAAFSDLEGVAWELEYMDVADINNDGYEDIMIGGESYDEPFLMMYMNNKGHFELYQDHGLPALFNVNFDWSDFDDDGDPDLLLSGGKDTPRTQVYVNTTEDRYGPTIQSMSPANDDTLVHEEGYKLSIRFHEKILPGSGMMRIFRSVDHTLIYQVSASDESVAINGTVAEITIHQNPFNQGEEVFVLIDESFVTDTHDNSFAGISDAETWRLNVETGKANQSISFSPLNVVDATSAPFELKATSSSKLPVTFSTNNASVATVAGNIVTVVGVGTTTITAHQEGNADFNAATPVERELVVDKAGQSIVFDAIPAKLVGDRPFSLNATATSGLPVSFSIGDPLIASIENNIVTILAAGKTTITAHQPGNNFFKEAQPESQPLTVSAITSISESQYDKIFISPNPATNWISINAYAETTETRPLRFLVYNSQGQVVMKDTSLTEKRSISLIGLPPGIYLLYVEFPTGMWLGRFVRL